MHSLYQPFLFLYLRCLFQAVLWHDSACAGGQLWEFDKQSKGLLACTHLCFTHTLSTVYYLPPLGLIRIHLFYSSILVSSPMQGANVTTTVKIHKTFGPLSLHISAVSHYTSMYIRWHDCSCGYNNTTNPQVKDLLSNKCEHTKTWVKLSSVVAHIVYH